MENMTPHEPTKLLQVEVPASWLKHLRIEALRRETKVKHLVMQAVEDKIGPPLPAEIAEPEPEAA